jgi:hypothetical protein
VWNHEVTSSTRRAPCDRNNGALKSRRAVLDGDALGRHALLDEVAPDDRGVATAADHEARREAGLVKVGRLGAAARRLAAQHEDHIRRRGRRGDREHQPRAEQEKQRGAQQRGEAEH